MKKKIILFLIIVSITFIVMSCTNRSSNQYLDERKELVVDTVYLENKWIEECNLRKTMLDSITHMEISVKIYSDTLIIKWDEKKDEIIGTSYLNRRILIGKYDFNFEQQYFQIYKSKPSEYYGFIPKDLPIYKGPDFLAFNLILYDNACTEDCYNYEILQCKIYKDNSHSPDIKMVECLSKTGIPKI